MFKVGEQKNSVQEALEILGCLVVIARSLSESSLRPRRPKQSLKAIVRLLRGAGPERHEILR